MIGLKDTDFSFWAIEMHLEVVLRHPRLRSGVQQLGHLIDRSREGNKNNHLSI